MAKDGFDATLTGFRRWTDTTKQKLSGDPSTDARELEPLFGLLRDHLGIGRPADLGQGDLEELLLRIYPRKITVLDRADTEDTIPAVRDFLAYLAESGEMAEAAVRKLERELDRIAPRFADAVMDPANWGMARSFVQAMAADGVEMGDQAAIDRWIAAYNARVDPLGGMPGPGEDFDDFEDESHAFPGEVAEAFQHADDDEVLDIWKMMFALVIGTTLEIAASLDPRRSRELDFMGHGAALAVMLFLARQDGLPVGEASEMIKSATVSELAPAQAAKAWESWVRAHGDPAGLLLDLMTEVGAVLVSDSDDGDLARLTPLGLAALRTQLVESGVDVPLLPPADQMTAADLIAMADGASEEEFQAEPAAWLAHRTPDSAARDLLSAAAEADPASRMLAVAVVTEFGAPAEPAWRDALGRPELRGYAKVTLAALAGADPAADVPDGLELAPDDLAWILTDGLVMEGWDELDDDAEHDPAELAERLRAAIPAGEEPAVFEMMARVPHPDAANVLTMVGRYHPDKKVAKAARKAAYKAASRQAAGIRR